MVTTPVPSRRRARATASLRRPVVWVSGVDIGDSSSSAGGGAGDGHRLGRLGLVRMVGAGVDLELRHLLTTERALREHALNAAAHRLGGLAGVELGEGLGLETTGVAGVAVHHG